MLFLGTKPSHLSENLVENTEVMIIRPGFQQQSGELGKVTIELWKENDPFAVE